MTDTNPIDVALENRLMSDGIYLLEYDRDDAGLSIEYEVVSPASAVTSDEVGAVVRTLLAVADEREWTPGRVEVTSRATDGGVRGRWHVEREWFDRLSTDLSEIEFSRRVLETMREYSE